MTAGDETRAACGFGNCAMHIGGQNFFYPLRMLNFQILNPEPAPAVHVPTFKQCRPAGTVRLAGLASSSRWR